MPKILDNFKKEIKKLEKYLVLREEKDDYLIIGTQISLNIHKEIAGGVFQPPHQKVVQKSFHVYFRIAFTEKDEKLKEYDYLPTLYLTNPVINPSKPSKVRKYTAEFRTLNPLPAVEYNERNMLKDVESFMEQTYYN